MADIIHRAQRDSNGCLLRRYSVNTPEYSTDDWLINPDLSGVSGVEEKYWKVTGTPPGGQVEEMTQAEKDSQDATLLDAAKQARRQYLADRGWTLMEQCYESQKSSLLMALFVNSKVNGMPNRAAHVQQVWDWKEGLAQHVLNKIDDVNAATTVDDVNAVELNESAVLDQDPGVTVASTMAITD